MAEDKIIKEQLIELLGMYNNGSFSLMACDYIRSTGMTPQEVKEMMGKQ